MPLAALAQSFSTAPGVPGDKPDLPPTAIPVGAITQNTSLDIDPVTGVTCNAGGVNAANSFLRRFLLTADHGIVDPYSVDSVDIGIETQTPGSAGSACEGNPITVNVYSIPIGDPMLYANMTLVETADFDIGAVAPLTLVNVPMPAAGEIDPDTSDMVVEWELCDHQAAGDGGTVFPGANTDPQIGPSYIAAATCGAVEPTDLASLGFPDLANVLSVEGSVAESLPRGTFRVDKVFTDSNPAEVNVAISCNTGLPLEQTFDISEGNGVVFIVKDYADGAMDCLITETPVPGYTTEYFDGTTTNNTGCAYDAVGFSQGNICIITNTPGPVTVTVNKEWIYQNTGNDIDESFEFEILCDAVITGGTDIGEGWYSDGGSGVGDDSFDFEVFPTLGGNVCSATEIPTEESGIVTDSSDCQNMPIGIAQGAECTITNSVFFEGIPTLNQYGMALLALLMLGVGVVGFRRFV